MPVKFHPIHYSLVFNLILLVGSLGLSCWLREPLVFIVGAMLMNHIPARFGDAPAGPTANRIGFLADMPEDDD